MNVMFLVCSDFCEPALQIQYHQLKKVANFAILYTKQA